MFRRPGIGKTLSPISRPCRPDLDVQSQPQTASAASGSPRPPPCHRSDQRHPARHRCRPANAPALGDPRYLGMTGTKFGCGVGACGACTVHLDGEATRACITTLADAAGPRIVTIEGLSPDGTIRCSRPGRPQRSPMRLLSARSDHAGGGASQADAKAHRSADHRRHVGNICRCGTYLRIRAAIKSQRDRCYDDAS